MAEFWRAWFSTLPNRLSHPAMDDFGDYDGVVVTG
jgi:hypothetical protein